MRRHLLFFFDDLSQPEPNERNVFFGSMKTIVKTALEPGDDAMIVTGLPPWRTVKSAAASPGTGLPSFPVTTTSTLTRVSAAALRTRGASAAGD
jgi:hypothetical protein